MSPEKPNSAALGEFRAEVSAWLDGLNDRQRDAVLHGDDKLINLLHRPAQLFSPATDPGEREDRATADRETLESLFQRLGEWEATLPTVPLWGSSPHWSGDSARIYDTWDPRPEPE